MATTASHAKEEARIVQGCCAAVVEVRLTAVGCDESAGWGW